MASLDQKKDEALQQIFKVRAGLWHAASQLELKRRACSWLTSHHSPDAELADVGNGSMQESHSVKLTPCEDRACSISLVLTCWLCTQAAGGSKRTRPRAVSGVGQQLCCLSRAWPCTSEHSLQSWRRKAELAMQKRLCGEPV